MALAETESRICAKLNFLATATEFTVNLLNHFREFSDKSVFHLKLTKSSVRLLNSRDPDKRRGQFECSVKGCGQVFTFKTNLDRHLKNVHSGRVYECQECLGEFANERAYERHIARTSNGFECLDIKCQKLFQTSCLLRQHRNSAHGCDIACDQNDCQRVFRFFADLKRHSELTHQQQQQPNELVCDVGDCNMKFSCMAFLKRHKDRHLKNKPFVCGYDCNSSFATQYELKKHIMRRHSKEKPFKCPKINCRKRYTTRDELKLHKQNKHLKPPKVDQIERPFKCGEKGCDKRFAQKKSLDEHKKCIHQNIRYKCSVENCGKSFSQKVSRQRHYDQMHSDERPFECPQDYCGHRLKTSNCLYYHIRRCHQIDDNDQEVDDIKVVDQKRSPLKTLNTNQS